VKIIEFLLMLLISV